jgi:hypothetical protein
LAITWKGNFLTISLLGLIAISVPLVTLRNVDLADNRPQDRDSGGSTKKKGPEIIAKTEKPPEIIAKTEKPPEIIAKNDGKTVTPPPPTEELRPTDRVAADASGPTRGEPSVNGSVHRLVRLKRSGARPDDAVKIWIMLVGYPSAEEVAGLANGAEEAGAVVKVITYPLNESRLAYSLNSLVSAGWTGMLREALSSSYRGGARRLPSTNFDVVAILGEPGPRGATERALTPERIVWICDRTRDVYVAPSASPWERWPSDAFDGAEVTRTVRQTARIVVPRGEPGATDFGRFLRAAKARRVPANGVPSASSP